MFKRLVFEDYAAICTIIAFAVVALVFLEAIWRALLMSRGQSEQMAALPFEVNPPAPTDRANAPVANCATARVAALPSSPHQAHEA